MESEQPKNSSERFFKEYRGPMLFGVVLFLAFCFGSLPSRCSSFSSSRTIAVKTESKSFDASLRTSSASVRQVETDTESLQKETSLPEAEDRAGSMPNSREKEMDAVEPALRGERFAPNSSEIEEQEKFIQRLKDEGELPLEIIQRLEEDLQDQ